MEIKQLSTITGLDVQLQTLLRDCVDSGASVGFLRPINDEQLKAYWAAVEIDLKSGIRQLFVAIDGDKVIGAVQLALSNKPNALHRGEVEKLMVAQVARGKGLSKKLMSIMESVASEINLSLLVLDTRLGDVASSLYRSIGYTEVGAIPQFARSSSGELEGTVYFYKLI